MCNRCNCQGGYTQSRCGEDRGFSRNGCSRMNCCGCQNAWQEAEAIMLEQERRRCREDRCAREFVRCMRCGRDY